MTDKELLELAAKACGVSGSYIRIDDGHNPLEVGIGDLTGTWWNPLVDDGDALRLAIQLGLIINPWPQAKKVFVGDGDGEGIVVSGDDLYVTTRRAQ